MTTGYIYVIKNEVGGLGGFKIGQTINPPRRFRELKLGTKSSLVGLWRSDKYASIERLLHKTFKHLRVPQSEWFALTPDTLQDVIGRLNRCSTCMELKSEYKAAEPVYVPPAYVEPYSPPIYNPPEPVVETKEPMGDLGQFLFGLVGGYIPVLGQLCLALLFFDKNTRDSAATKGLAFGTAIMLFMAIASSANSKPLHTYEERPHINVSSLIK